MSEVAGQQRVTGEESVGEDVPGPEQPLAGGAQERSLSLFDTERSEDWMAIGLAGIAAVLAILGFLGWLIISSSSKRLDQLIGGWLG